MNSLPDIYDPLDSRASYLHSCAPEKEKAYPYFLEGMSEPSQEVENLMQILSPLFEIVPYEDDPLNCRIAAKSWEAELQAQGVQVERIDGEFLTKHGSWPHEYLLVGEEKLIFDPTYRQFAEEPKAFRYIIELPDTDDQIGASVHDLRKEGIL